MTSPALIRRLVLGLLLAEGMSGGAVSTRCPVRPRAGGICEVGLDSPDGAWVKASKKAANARAVSGLKDGSMNAFAAFTRRIAVGRPSRSVAISSRMPAAADDSTAGEELGGVDGDSALCDNAEAHDALCIDVRPALNGPTSSSR